MVRFGLGFGLLSAFRTLSVVGGFLVSSGDQFNISFFSVVIQIC